MRCKLSQHPLCKKRKCENIGSREMRPVVEETAEGKKKKVGDVAGGDHERKEAKNAKEEKGIRTSCRLI